MFKSDRKYDYKIEEKVMIILFHCLHLFSGLDMVVRDESGNILDINKTSTTQLYINHTSAEERITRAQVKCFILKFLYHCLTNTKFSLYSILVTK